MSSESGVQFRSIQSSDMESIRTLHDEFFPVKYSDQFYANICNGIGPDGGVLFSSIATTANGSIEGFILAQMFDYPSRCEDKDMFSFDRGPAKVCYIITLGVVKSARQSGLGSALVRNCCNYARADRDCGGVYLHVLDSNEAAINFYKKNDFYELRFLEDFYHFNQAYHSAFLYVLYMDGFSPPLRTRLWSSTNHLLESGRTLVNALLSLVPRLLALPAVVAGIFGTVPLSPSLLTEPPRAQDGVDQGHMPERGAGVMEAEIGCATSVAAGDGSRC